MKIICLLVIVFCMTGITFAQRSSSKQKKSGIPKSVEQKTENFTINYKSLTLVKTLKANNYFWKNSDVYVTTIAFSPDGKIIASTLTNMDDTSRGRPARHVLWNIETGKSIMTTPVEDENEYVVFSPDGTKIATGGMRPKLWDISTGKHLRTFIINNGHDWSGATVHFSPDGKIIAIGGSWASGYTEGDSPSVFQIWNLQTGKLIKEITETFYGFYKINFSSDGSILVGTTPVSVWIRNAKNGSLIRKLDKDFFHNSVFVTPDGNILTFGQAQLESSTDNGQQYIKLWNVKTGKLLSKQKVNIFPQSDLGNGYLAIFSPDGKTIANCTLENSIKFWDVETGRMIYTLTNENKDARCETLTFSPNGEVLAAGDTDGFIRIWKVNN